MVDELALRTGFGLELIGYILSSVQFGFIIGTLTFALLMIADRFSPSRVFLVCAILAALCNMTLLSTQISKTTLLIARFGTGFFLAGIYPVGMKIAADYFDRGLGKALGYLVGALVFGKSFPYFVKSLDLNNSFDAVIKVTSLMAASGGILLWAFVPDGPFRKASRRLRLSAGPALFKIKGFRKAALGYFGHMWELYAFWAFVPFALNLSNTLSGNSVVIDAWAFIIIALGGVSCIIGGHLSLIFGSKKVALTALVISGLFCLVSPILFQIAQPILLAAFCLWGMAVTADSPQFSSLVASSIPPELKGTGLTLVNCIGFALSIVSIELISLLSGHMNSTLIFMTLAIGPILGVFVLWKKSR